MIEHELKTWPPHWQDVNDGTKTVEIRRNDRDYQVGDALVLREWDPDARTVDPDTQVETPGRFTGRACLRMVTHVLPGGAFGLDVEHVALSVAVDKPERCCTQCGQRWADRACGPTHALITEELGVGDLRREADRLRQVEQDACDIANCPDPERRASLVVSRFDEPRPESPEELRARLAELEDQS